MDAVEAVLSNLEILERIMTLLPKPADVRRCGRVDKSFRACSRSDSLWRSRADMHPTAQLSGVTPNHEDLLIQRIEQHVGKLLVRARSFYINSTIPLFLWHQNKSLQIFSSLSLSSLIFGFHFLLLRFCSLTLPLSLFLATTA